MPRPLEVRTIVVDSRYTKSQRLEIGRKVIDYIVNRTKAGKGPENKRLVSRASGNLSYSGNYTKTTEFKSFNKSAAPINLTLTGDMLASIEVIDVDIPGRITYGFQAGFENDKASWLGDKGFEFLNISNAELNKILTNTTKPKDGPIDETLRSSFTANALRKIIDN